MYICIDIILIQDIYEGREFFEESMHSTQR